MSHLSTSLSSQRLKSLAPAPNKTKLTVGKICYNIWKYTTITIITLLLLLPVVYKLGEEYTIVSQKPLFDVYSNDLLYQQKIQQIQLLLQAKKSPILNLYQTDQKNSTNQDWDNFEDFLHYYAYKSQEAGTTTIFKDIYISKDLSQEENINQSKKENINQSKKENIPQRKKENKSKKGKKAMSEKDLELKEKEEEKAYELDEFSESYKIKQKINKVVHRILKRLQIKLSSLKPKKCTQFDLHADNRCAIRNELKNYLYSNLNGKNQWLITLHIEDGALISQNMLAKSINKVIENHKADSILIVTLSPLKLQYQRFAKPLKSIPIHISNQEIYRFKSQIKQKIDEVLNLNHQNSSAKVICLNSGSLKNINQYLTSCNYKSTNTLSYCSHWIDQLELQNLKSIQKQQNLDNFVSRYYELCRKGSMKIQSIQHRSMQIYNELGVIYETNSEGDLNLAWSSEQFKQFYEIANQVSCKTAHFERDNANQCHSKAQSHGKQDQQSQQIQQQLLADPIQETHKQTKNISEGQTQQQQPQQIQTGETNLNENTANQDDETQNQPDIQTSNNVQNQQNINNSNNLLNNTEQSNIQIDGSEEKVLQKQEQQIENRQAKGDENISHEELSEYMSQTEGETQLQAQSKVSIETNYQKDEVQQNNILIQENSIDHSQPESEETSNHIEGSQTVQSQEELVNGEDRGETKEHGGLTKEDGGETKEDGGETKDEASVKEVNSQGKEQPKDE